VRGGLEVRHELQHVLREGIGVAVERPSQRPRCGVVRAGSASEPEVDSSGKERFEGAELLGDDQRRMIRQHDAARADANRSRRASHVRDDDRRGCAGDARHVVVFGQPVAREAPPLDMLGKIHRMTEGIRGGSTLDDGRKIQYRKGHHPPSVSLLLLRYCAFSRHNSLCRPTSAF